MTEIYTDDLLAGYDELRESREWSVEAMAESIENQSNDPALAAKYRERYAEQAPTKRESAPKGRRSKADADTVEG